MKDGGAVALVLGAGNISSIGPLDALTKLVAEDQVVLLKMHPLVEDLAPLLERAFRALTDEGFLGIVTGGAGEGAYLCRHPLVETVHLTGSSRTYEAIVWGETPEERARRKTDRRPLVEKPMTAELGCVTPVLVTPGEWTPSELAYQARHVAGMVAHNAGFNCNSAQVLVLARGWRQRDAFVTHLASALAAIPPRVAYYPGAADRHRAFLDRYPQASIVGAPAAGALPWTIVPDVPPSPDEYALVNEAFCGVLAVVSIDADDALSFLARAVPFANQSLSGTLSCTLLVDPRTLGAHETIVEDAIADLRYGGVGVNVWAAVNYSLGVTTWGAYPGHTPDDIGSGVGVVHNAFLFDHPEKSVTRAPFTMRPTPVWFADHENLADLGRRLVAFEADPSWLKFPGLLLAASRG